MTIEIHISGANVAEVRDQLAKLIGVQAMPITLPPQDANKPLEVDAKAFLDSDGVIKGQPEEAPKKRTRAKKAEPAPEQTIPDADDDADAAQDDSDERENVEQADGKLTHDDVRGALARYMKKFGIGPTQLDGPKVLGMIFGEACTKASDVPNDQESIGKAIAGIEEMLAKNPFKRTAV